MILTVDIGNTNSCFALFDSNTADHNASCKSQWRLSTNRMRTADEFTLWIENFLSRNEYKAGDISQTIIACVVPACRFPIQAALKNLVSHEPVLIDAATMQKLGVEVLTDRPKEVGADRLINAYAAAQLLPDMASIVIDFGTATTFDVVTKQGDYAGGVIAPGINLSLQALQQAAALLPSIEIIRPAKAIGTNTESAMQSGLFYGYLGLIERIVAQCSVELDESPKVIATGGLAPLFAKHCNKIDQLEADLTMQGLYRVAQQIA